MKKVIATERNELCPSQCVGGVTCVLQGRGLLFGSLVYEVFHKDESRWTSMKGNHSKRLKCLDYPKSFYFRHWWRVGLNVVPTKVKRVLTNVQNGFGNLEFK